MSYAWSRQSSPRVFERGVDAALRGVGVAADGVDFGNDGDIRAVLPSGQGRSHAGKPGADDDDVV